MFTEKTKKNAPKAPTKARLRNIALYYLERFESSEETLRQVLKRRINKYAFVNKEYNPSEAYQWTEEVIDECLSHNFVNDRRFAEFKVNGYLNAGKPKRYIEQKLKQKGIDEKTISSVFEEANYSEKDTALNFAQKKKIGCFRNSEEERQNFRQKDLGTLIRAGFDYDIAKEIVDEDCDDF